MRRPWMHRTVAHLLAWTTMLVTNLHCCDSRARVRGKHLVAPRGDGPVDAGDRFDDDISDHFLLKPGGPQFSAQKMATGPITTSTPKGVALQIAQDEAKPLLVVLTASGAASRGGTRCSLLYNAILWDLPRLTCGSFLPKVQLERASAITCLRRPRLCPLPGADSLSECWH
jgi:hypothetical protein